MKDSYLTCLQYNCQWVSKYVIGFDAHPDHPNAWLLLRQLADTSVVQICSYVKLRIRPKYLPFRRDKSSCTFRYFQIHGAIRHLSIFQVYPPLLKPILRRCGRLSVLSRFMTIHTPHTVPVTCRDILLLFFNLPCIYGVIYWGYAVENIARGAVDWHEYFVTVSNEGPGMIHYFPLTNRPVITPMLKLSVRAIYMREQIKCMQFLLLMFWGSESFLSSTDIFGLRVSQGTSETFLCFTLVNHWKAVAPPNVRTLQIQIVVILLSSEGNRRTQVLHCFHIYIAKRPKELLQSICC